jgi:hypothetical protein
MTSFEAGFIKYAEECGLSNEQAAYILKRAADHPDTQELFKELPHTEEESGEDLDNLKDMLSLDELDKQMQLDSSKLQPK